MLCNPGESNLSSLTSKIFMCTLKQILNNTYLWNTHNSEYRHFLYNVTNVKLGYLIVSMIIIIV